MRVLVVEDDEALAATLDAGLRAEGHDVDVSHDGLDGLWRAQEGRYGAVVLDVLLPGLNGFRVCRTLRDTEVWTPVLMLTAKDGEYDVAEGLDAGADDYLTKPFSFVELSARLRALARRGQEPRPAVLTCGDLSLDPATLRCHRADAAVELTPRERALLEALLRVAPDVMTRPRLLDEVWGLDFAGDPSVLDVYVGYLRRKIDRPFGVESIETVRGVGFRIVDPARR